MTELYLRKAKLQIIPQNANQKIIEGLKIEFVIEKNDDSNPNKAVFDVYNLSETTRTILESDKTQIIFSAGYSGQSGGVFDEFNVFSQGSLATVCIGNVTKCFHGRNGPDIVTTFEVGDGANQFRNAYLDKGYPKNVNLNTILNDLIEAMRLGRGQINGIPSRTYLNGVTLTGLCKTNLTKYCESNGLKWSIQNQTVSIYPKNGASGEGVTLLSKDTGLVDAPKKTEKGILFKSLLQPSLIPGRKVKIDSQFVKGNYIVSRVTHQGNNQEGKFLSECEAKNV